MGFGENLQFLRKKKNITQEQLAEQLEVSRQSVSKWESDISYPEMEKLLQICDLFSCDLDTLLRGNVQEHIQEDSAEYDNHMNWFSKAIASGVCLVLLGVSLLIALQTIPLIGDFSVLFFLCFVIVAVVIFIPAGISHDDFLKKHQDLRPFYPQEVRDRFQKKFMFTIAAGVALILIGVVLLVGVGAMPKVSEKTTLQFTALFLFFVAIAATAFVYIGLQKSKYDFEEIAVSEESKKAGELIGKICGCIMLTATAIFLTLGFVWNLWHVSWVVFPVGGILCGIVSTIFSKTK